MPTNNDSSNSASNVLRVTTAAVLAAAAGWTLGKVVERINVTRDPTPTPISATRARDVISREQEMRATPETTQETEDWEDRSFMIAMLASAILVAVGLAAFIVSLMPC